MELMGSSTSLEIEVCNILLNLKKTIREFDCNLHWVGAKARRERKSRTSPNTPLSIPVHHHPEISNKRTREDMSEKIEELLHNKKHLRGLQLPLLENQGQPQLDDMDKYQPSDSDSCKQISIKPFLGFDLNELPPLDDCEMEWSQPLDQS